MRGGAGRARQRGPGDRRRQRWRRAGFSTRAKAAGAVVVCAGENLGFAGRMQPRRPVCGQRRARVPEPRHGHRRACDLGARPHARGLGHRGRNAALAPARSARFPNSAGCEIHISGLAWSGGFGASASSIDELREITYANGFALAIRADLFQEVGGFTDEFFIYHEDLELCWKAAHARAARGQGHRTPTSSTSTSTHETPLRTTTWSETGSCSSRRRTRSG